MKIIDKFFYWIISFFMFVISVIIILGILNVFGFGENIFLMPINMYRDAETSTKTIILAVSAVLLFMSIKGLFFQTKINLDDANGILLENNNGKLSISRETLQNLIKDISTEIGGTEIIRSHVFLSKTNELIVKIDAVVYKEVNIKEVTKEIQENIKRAIKNMTDIEVSEVNINIKNISNKRGKRRDINNANKGNENIIVVDEEKIKEEQKKEEKEIIEENKTKEEKEKLDKTKDEK